MALKDVGSVVSRLHVARQTRLCGVLPAAQFTSEHLALVLFSHVQSEVPLQVKLLSTFQACLGLYLVQP